MDHIWSTGLRSRSLGVNPATAVVHCVGRRWIAAIALASLQSSESNPHCPHRSTLTFPILPYRLARSLLPGGVGTYHWRVGFFASVDKIGRQARSHSCQRPIQASLGAEGSAEAG